MLKLRTRFLLTNVCKKVFGNCFTFLDLELLPKLKIPGFYILVFCFFINDSRSKQNTKKSHTPFCRHCMKRAQNVIKKKSVVVEDRQSFQFFTQITWFLGNNRASSKLRYQILHNLLVSSNYKKISL